MKRISALSMAVILSMPAFALAQSSGDKGMDMKGSAQDKPRAAGRHQTAAVVKAVDRNKGTVTLAHQAIASLNWPAMTMSFAVKDRNLFDKLAVGRNVKVELTQQGGSYVVTAVD
jgi:Cu(I)/Ag(I) efflux system protein CusF